MSQVTLIFGIAPAIAPVIGGALLNTFGWRAIFWFLLAFTLALIAWCLRALPETLPPAARQPLHPRALWRNYRTVLTRLDFLLLAAIPALNFAAFFVYVARRAGVPGRPARRVDAGLRVAVRADDHGIMIGALISGRVAGRLSLARTVRLGYAFAFAGVALNLAVCAAHLAHVAWHVLPIFVFCIGSAIIMPSITLILLDLFPRCAGYPRRCRASCSSRSPR